MKYRRDRARQKGFTLFELIVVLCMIGVLMAVSFSYYQAILVDARKAGVKMLASRFTAATTMLHIKWQLNEFPQYLHLEQGRYQMNKKGWPIGVEAPYIDNNLNDCQQLWEGLFQNPGDLSDSFPKDERGAQYWVNMPRKGVCRYQLVSKNQDIYYFDYDSSNGMVKYVVN